MLLSVFTPSHDTKHLKEAYDSLQMQQHTDWEWIIGLNGDAKLPDHRCFREDKRIKAFGLQASSSNVGALKFACCQRAQGEVLIELDHDDVLWPEVMTHIIYQADAGADFIYSDAASFDEEENRPIQYSGDHGWETYSVKLYDKELTATRNFDITPRSLCEVYYAPDHVRCWRRSFYNKIGGHDVTLSVGDDHDLMCRSYLAHGKFAHTGTVGYVYRFHRGNTVKARSKNIWQQVQKNKAKYLHKLVDEWCRRHHLLYVDLEKSVEWMDNKPILKSIQTGTVGCIRAYNVLHWVPQDEVPAVMEEFHRVLAPSGWLCCQVYSTNGPGAFIPTAKSYWNMLTFDYFCNKQLAIGIQPFRGRFQRVQCFEAYVNPKLEEPTHCISVYADLCAIKDQRQPGPVLI